MAIWSALAAEEGVGAAAGVAAEGTSSAAVGSSAGSSAGSTVSSGVSGADTVNTQQATTSGSSSGSLVGGALDSLGLNAGSWVDRVFSWEQNDKANEFNQQQLELQKDKFLEDTRRWGLNFALNEVATRRGWQISKVQNVYNMLANQQSLQSGQQSLAQTSNAMKDSNRNRTLAKAFLRGFTSANVSMGGKK